MKLLIIGGGAISDSTHIPAAKALLPNEDIFIAEPNAAQADHIRHKYNLNNVVSNYADVISMVDSCIIATPPHVHNTILADCVSANVNVLCEKPLSPSSSETQKILAEAKSGMVMGMCHTYRLFNNRKKCRELIQSGYFGKNVEIVINEGAPSGWPTVSGYCFNKRLVPGGVLYDNGIHSLDFIYWCLGMPNEIEYEDDAEGGLESNAVMKFHYPNSEVFIKFSRTTELSNTIRVKGNGHVAVLEIFEMNEWVLDGNRLIAEGEKMDWENIGVIQLQNFISAVEGKSLISCPIEDGLKVVRILEQCYSQKKEKPYEKHPIGGLKGKTVLVTGGTGFIGRHLVEQLVLHENAKVRVPVHKWSSAAYISRFDVELVQGDLNNENFVDSVVEGCDYIVHCALSTGTGKEEFIQNNVMATKNVLVAAQKHGVKYVVQLSSVVVHGETIPDYLTADFPLVSYGDEYADAKLQSEQTFWSLLKQYGLHGSIIRPTYVWGPYSTWYTFEICKQIKSKKFAWVNHGKGVCNAVYVGNVVDMCIECCVNSKSDGQAFIATDGENMTWRTFYGYYFDMLGMNPPRYPSFPLKENIARTIRKKYIIPFLKHRMDRMWEKVVKTKERAPFISKWLYRAPRKIVKSMWRFCSRYTPEKEAAEVAIYSQKKMIDVKKNVELLGFKPRYSVEKGMKVTGDWLLWSDLFQHNN